MKDKKQLPHQQYLASLNKPFKEHTKEERKEYCRLYRETYKPKPFTADQLAKRKQYCAANKERRNALDRERWHNMTSEQKEARRRYRQARYMNYLRHDQSYLNRRKLSNWINNNCRRYSGTRESWIKHIGCTKEEFKAHIESQFVEGMSWDNWTVDGWHLDHIIPLSKGGTNHYTNLQPLWAKDNLSKSNKII